MARTLCELPNTVAIAADDFWYNIGEGEYAFDSTRLSEAHKWCRDSVEGLMVNNFNIVLHNTNTSEKEIDPYIKLADKYNYKVVSLLVENRHNNKSVHDVPIHVLKRQENNLRSSLKLM